MTVINIFATVLISCLVVHQENDIFTFSNIDGNTRAAISPEIRCEDRNGHMFCTLKRVSIAEQKINSSRVYVNDDGRVYLINMSLPDYSYDVLVDVFTERYGPPTSVTSSIELNIQGGPYNIRVSSWENLGGGNIRISQDGDRHTSYVAISFAGNADAPIRLSPDF